MVHEKTTQTSAVLYVQKNIDIALINQNTTVSILMNMQHYVDKLYKRNRPHRNIKYLARRAG